MRLVEEVGETARLINHLYGHKKKKDSEPVQELGIELAVICLANSQGIDLEEAFEKMMVKYSVRDKMVVQREGKNEEKSVSFTLVGTMNPEEGGLRPQLLDRFALRLSGRVTKTTDRPVEILSWIDCQTSEEETKSEPLPAEICDASAKLPNTGLRSQTKPKQGYSITSPLWKYTALAGRLP